MKAAKITPVALVALGLMVLTGCGNSMHKGHVAPPDPLANAQGADLQRNTEVQLVEQMSRYRLNYRQHLELMHEFYDRQGNQLKADWVDQELDHLQAGPQRPYLVVAELAGADLRATTAIPEADVTYAEALALLKEGSPKLFNLWPDEKKLYLAIDKFNELITTHPTSDKIDDAAFHIGDINRRYLKDYNAALVYYQRTWQWDPQTTLPVRYATALIYDEHIHDLIKAMHYYEQAVNLESNYADNVLKAQKRIEAISNELGASPDFEQ